MLKVQRGRGTLEKYGASSHRPKVSALIGRSRKKGKRKKEGKTHVTNTCFARAFIETKLIADDSQFVLHRLLVRSFCYSFVPPSRRQSIHPGMSLTLHNAPDESQDWLLSGGHEGAVLACAFANAGSTAVSGGLDARLCIWDLAAGTNYVVEHPGRARAAITSLQPLDKSCVAAFSDAHLALVDLETGITLRRYTGHTRVVNQVRRAGTRHQIASVGDDGQLLLWDAATKKPVWSTSTQFPLMTLAAADDHLVYATGLEPTIHVFDLRNISKELFNWPTMHDDSICSIDVSPNGKLCSLGFDGQLQFYDAATGSSRKSRYLNQCPTPNAPPNDDRYLVRCKFIHGDRYAITEGAVYDVTSQVKLADHHTAPVIDMDYHGKSNSLLMCANDGSLRVTQL